MPPQKPIPSLPRRCVSGFGIQLLMNRAPEWRTPWELSTQSWRLWPKVSATRSRRSERRLLPPFRHGSPSRHISRRPPMSSLSWPFCGVAVSARRRPNGDSTTTTPCAACSRRFWDPDRWTRPCSPSCNAGGLNVPFAIYPFCLRLLNISQNHTEYSFLISGVKRNKHYQ